MPAASSSPDDSSAGVADTGAPVVGAGEPGMALALGATAAAALCRGLQAAGTDAAGLGRRRPAQAGFGPQSLAGLALPPRLANGARWVALTRLAVSMRSPGLALETFLVLRGATRP